MQQTQRCRRWFIRLVALAYAVLLLVVAPCPQGQEAVASPSGLGGPAVRRRPHVSMAAGLMLALGMGLGCYMVVVAEADDALERRIRTAIRKVEQGNLEDLAMPLYPDKGAAALIALREARRLTSADVREQIIFFATDLIRVGREQGQPIPAQVHEACISELVGFLERDPSFKVRNRVSEFLLQEELSRLV
ncbi:MAG: hypothetical protein ACE5R4_14720, partial [Armatimonadota bacterium]